MSTSKRTTGCVGFLAKLKHVLLADKQYPEKRLVQKLDFFILTYCCLSSFFNYVDRQSFANAYVAGLKEDIGLSGNDYNVILAMFTAGSVIGQFPHSVILHKIPPRIWLPSMVLVWAGITMTCAACRTYAQFCAVRFLQGLAEASTYCGTIYIIGSWYKPSEIATRTAIFTAAGQAGSMFAGIIMAAIYNGMNGYQGLRGWQWLFIINGIITCPIAIMGFIYFPDTPETTKAPFLSQAERELALARLPPKKADGHNVNFLSLSKRVFGSSAFYIFIGWAVITGALEAFVLQGLFLLWMKANQDHFSQTQINTYPLGIQAVGIVSNFLAAVHIDLTGKRVPMGVLAALLQLVSAIMLLVPSLPFAGTFFAFYLAGTSYIVNPVSYGWANIVLQRSGDDAARSVILYGMNAFQTCLYTFWGIALYPASDAPYWKKGYITMIVVVFSMLVFLLLVQSLDKETLAKYGDTAVRDLPLEAEGSSVQEAEDASGSEVHTEKGVVKRESVVQHL